MDIWKCIEVLVPILVAWDSCKEIIETIEIDEEGSINYSYSFISERASLTIEIDE